VNFGGVVASAVLGDTHTCALLTSGSVKCLGGNTNIELGAGSAIGTKVSTAQTVSTIGSAAVQISAGAFHTCALLNSSKVYCWGQNANKQSGSTATGTIAPTQVTLPIDITSVQAGYNQTCALTASGHSICWGLNTDGQLGNGSTNSSGVTPVYILGTYESIDQIAMGNRMSCWVKGGTLSCAGNSINNQLGIVPNTSTSYYPILIPLQFY
jgi:alpha-tubulin suppressor-like RCC1 family protein